MYGFISGISDTDDINYCPKCGREILGFSGGREYEYEKLGRKRS